MTDEDTKKHFAALDGTVSLAMGTAAGLTSGACLQKSVAQDIANNYSLEEIDKNEQLILKLEPIILRLKAKNPGFQEIFNKNLKEAFAGRKRMDGSGWLEDYRDAFYKTIREVPGSESFAREPLLFMDNWLKDLSEFEKYDAKHNKVIDAKGLFKGVTVFKEGSTGIKMAIVAVSTAVAVATGIIINAIRHRGGPDSHTACVSNEREQDDASVAGRTTQ